jgi:uncharacterized DUF497 family protein
MFEYNPDKSRNNEKKHGIDFETAAQLWKDPNRIIIPAKVVGESRFMLIGKMGDDTWSAIFTLRKENIRIISVRKATKNEKEIYNQ